MTTKEHVTIYKCDHCRKYGLSKSNIQKHEQFCFKNPDNVPLCFGGCAHFDTGTNDDGVKFYWCAKKSIGLMSKKQIVLGKNPVTYNAIPMPLEQCSDFENENLIPITN